MRVTWQALTTLVAMVLLCTLALLAAGCVGDMPRYKRTPNLDKDHYACWVESERPRHNPKYIDYYRQCMAARGYYETAPTIIAPIPPKVETTPTIAPTMSQVDINFCKKMMTSSNYPICKEVK